MNATTLSSLNCFAKPVLIFVLCCTAALTRADNIEHVSFEPRPPDDLNMSSNAFSGAQRVASGTATGRDATASLMAPLMFGKPDKRPTQRVIDSHLLGIEAMTQRLGPYAPALNENMLALGELYQREQQHDKAIELLSQARHVSRVNYGLDAPEQFPAIELTIKSHLALHDYQQAVDQQQVLVHLYESHYGADAPELVPELVTLGDMYFSAFERWRQETPGGSAITLEYGPATGFVDLQQLQPIDIAFLCLFHAQQNYLKSIQILVDRQQYRHPELAPLERHVLTTLFLQAHRRELESDRVFFLGETERLRPRGSSEIMRGDEKLDYYRDGEQSFSRLLYYLQQDPAVAPAQTAEVMLELGDWHRLFGRFRKSEEAYEQARTFLQAHEADAAEVAQLLAPTVPVQLPTFMPPPHSFDTTAEQVADVDADGYVDVAFTIDRNGNAKDFEVLSRSDNASPAIESRLLKVVKNAPFRPQLAAGDESGAEPAPVTVRYHFAQY